MTFYYSDARFGVFVAMTIHVAVFWVATHPEVGGSKVL
jgi:hypothetical protein